MRVSFAYWGEHEIWNRLTRDEHRGRLLFWFNEQWFSDEWLRQRVDEAHKNAGKRYIPSLHVALDIEHSFEALGRSPEFFVRLSDRIGSVRRELDHVRMDHISTPAVQEAAREIAQVVRDLAGTGATTRSAIEPLPLAEVARLADRGEELAFRFVAAPQQLPAVTARATDAYSYERHHLYLLQDRFADLKEFVRSPEASVANAGILLLVGDAGTGKTHMFCEIARRRLEAGGPSVLFLGEQFVPGEPWAQMLTILGVRCDRDELLGALEAAAEARGTRALILVDAINEEHGQEIWPKYLSGMLTQIKRHPRIGVALSVRSSYETSVLPTQLETNGTIVRFVHSGFEGHEEQGVDRYFAHMALHHPPFQYSIPSSRIRSSCECFARAFRRGVFLGYRRALAGSRRSFSFSWNP
jgi:hypothetical protein